MSGPIFNWLSLVGKLKGCQREVLEDTVERIVRIYDCWEEGRTESDAEGIVEDIEDVLEDLRRDL